MSTTVYIPGITVESCETEEWERSVKRDLGMAIISSKNLKTTYVCPISCEMTMPDDNPWS